MNPRKLIIHATPISKNRNQQKDFKYKYIYRECTRHEIVLTQIPWNQWYFPAKLGENSNFILSPHSHKYYLDFIPKPGL